MTKRKRILIIVVLQFLITVYGAYAVYQYYMNSVYVGEIIGFHGVADGSRLTSIARDDLPRLDTRNKKYRPYLMYAQRTIAEKYEYYFFYFGKDLDLTTNVRRTGLFSVEITYSGTGIGADGAKHRIDDRFDINYLDIYWGREATIEVTQQGSGDDR